MHDTPSCGASRDLPYVGKNLVQSPGNACDFGGVPSTPPDIDRVLDAAGAPHTNEKGSLTTAQRVEWLARQNEKWRACNGGLRIAMDEQLMLDRVRAERDASSKALFDIALALEAADGGTSGTYENGPPRIRALAKARDEAREQRDKATALAMQAEKRAEHAEAWWRHGPGISNKSTILQEGKRLCFEDDLRHLLNCHSKENASGTPDHVLAAFLCRSLETWNLGVRERESMLAGSCRPPRPQ